MFSNIIKSIYNPVFYQELKNKPLSFSFKYYFFLILLVSVIFTVVVMASFVPTVVGYMNQFGADLIASYPSDLELTIKNGEVSTNKPNPVVIAFGGLDQLPTEVTEDNKKVNLVVIDTDKAVTVENFVAADTFVLIGKNEVAMQDDEAVKIVKIGPTTSFKITDADVNNYGAKAMSWIKIIYPIAVVGSFLYKFIFLTFYLLILLISAVFVFLLLYLFGRRVSYGKAYQVTLHAVTLVIVLDLILSISSMFGLASFDLTYWMNLVIVFVLVFFNTGSYKPVTVPQL